MPPKTKKMKTSGTSGLIFALSFVIAFGFIPFHSNAQFLNKDAIWTVRLATYGDGLNEGFIDISIQKDSLINDVNYSLFEYSDDLFALREDSNKVIYKVLEHNFPIGVYDTLEHVLYDFNLTTGDSIFLNLPLNSDYYKNKWVVREVDSVIIGNDFKKRILLEITPVNYGYGLQYWIEDVGSTFGPLCFTGISEHERETELFCYRLKDANLYGKCMMVDAGNDLIVCSGENNEEYKIGGSPTASGGVEPYKYTWSGKLLLASSPENAWIYASNILDDTTKSNPALKNLYLLEEPIIFYLKVEDATCEIVYDSVRIDNSTFFVQSIYILPDTIIKGDSIKLIGDPYFINNFLPLAYYLSPSHGLIDSMDIYGWAKPDTSVTYYLQALNSVGCVSEKIQYWHIEVIDTTINSVQNISAINKYLQFFPNPAKNQLTISNPSSIKIKKIEMFDFSGRVVQQWEAQELARGTLKIQHIPPGVYLLKAETETGIKTEKLVIQ